MFYVLLVLGNAYVVWEEASDPSTIEYKRRDTNDDENMKNAMRVDIRNMKWRRERMKLAPDINNKTNT